MTFSDRMGGVLPKPIVDFAQWLESFLCPLRIFHTTDERHGLVVLVCWFW
jgi:hypothetical protein